MAATSSRTSALEVGALAIAPAPRGATVPSGTTHLVEGWEPVCGGTRVRFIFPGRSAELTATCPECADALAATPRPRPATRSTPAARPAPRTRARAS